MTEEQEKIIDVALWSWVILSPHERRDKYKDLMRVIRTVAVEVWKEGIDEMLDAAIKEVQAGIALTEDMRIAAKRLKEQKG